MLNDQLHHKEMAKLNDPKMDMNHPDCDHDAAADYKMSLGKKYDNSNLVSQAYNHVLISKRKSAKDNPKGTVLQPMESKQ